jgi:hypothetical protein
MPELYLLSTNGALKFLSGISMYEVIIEGPHLGIYGPVVNMTLPWLIQMWYGRT